MRLMPLVTGCYYHIFNRGVDRRETFVDDRDREKFLTYLHDFTSKGLLRFVDIVSYALMPNHFHLLLCQRADGGISKFMQKLGSGFTQYFNRRHQRSGSLFESTFKSVFIETTSQLLYVSRYIHRNPHELGFPLAEYSWSSLRHYLGLNVDPILRADELISCFSGPMDYLQYMQEQGDVDKVATL